ncbi:RNA polymerase sigma factor (sigma-70 family) [Marinisporobacter balticus]|uniref:RNA polymerase sigma factor (Sigma-70 family) n=1 Tax=Marinisporobacter balticus TaxID=2018667 RepID=A0A4R2KE21_9FIRM|nr:RNA polymerase sigma factor (sigma-70 family) [Marinisporobacter balticus]
MELYALIEAAQKENKESTANIFSHFHPTIKKLSKGLHYEEAETDMIILFLELIKNINIENFYDADDKQIASFIHKYLRNRSLDLFRKYELRHTPWIEMNYDILSDENTPDIESTVFISMLLNALIPLQRQVILRKFIYGFSDAEIAKQLGVSRQAINRIKNRALDNLKKILIKDGGEIVGRKDNRTCLQSRYMDSTNSSTNILYSQEPREKRSAPRRTRSKVSNHYI